MHQIIPYILPAVGCFITCCFYAFLLSTPTGKQWTLHKTHYTVVCGVGIVLIWMAVADWKAALVAFVFFAISALPIMFRSEKMDMDQRNSLTKKAMGE